MRISGITIPENKRLDIALTAIYGIGRSKAAFILKEASVDPSLRADKLSAEQESKIKEIISKMTIEGDLKRQVSADIKRLIDIASYRGIRHTKNLPVRGQTTKTNSRTVRGNKRKTMGSGRITVTKK